MSTYLYLVCLDHTPPLMAASDSGQHLSDLPQIRADIAARDSHLAVVAASEFGVPDLGPFRTDAGSTSAGLGRAAGSGWSCYSSERIAQHGVRHLAVTP